MDCSRPSDSQTAITKPSRALSENEFFHEILSWKVQNLLNSQSYGGPASLDRTSVPTSFKSMDQYYDTFKPLLFMEVWEQVVKLSCHFSRLHVKTSPRALLNCLNICKFKDYVCVLWSFTLKHLAKETDKRLC